jgi:endonuclease/exonuclease/phosphatase family metal-dependent hydrolase
MAHKIVHLNCRIFAGTGIAFFKRDLIYRDDERIEQICAWVAAQNASVVILSELWSESAKDTIEHNLSALPSLDGGGVGAPRYPFFLRAPANPCCMPICEAVKVGPEFLIASKMEMHDIEFTRFTDLASWDAMSRKGVLSFCILGSFICATHFDATNAECKVSNLLQTIQHVRAYSRGRPTIVVGDLNVCEIGDPGELNGEYLVLRNAMNEEGFIDVYRAFYPSFISMPGLTLDAINNSVARHCCNATARLDYFWTRGFAPALGATHCEVALVELSDHYPIVLTLDFL